MAHLRMYIKMVADGLDLDYQDATGYTALMHALARGEREAVEYLVEKRCDVYPTENNGLTCLHIAVSSGHARLVELLLGIPSSKNGKLVTLKDHGGRGAAHYAAQLQSAEILNILYDEGADVLSPDDIWGWSPLHYAAHTGCMENAKRLVNLGANIHGRSRTRQTVLQLAQEAGHDDLAAYLLSSLATRPLHRVLDCDTDMWLGPTPAEVWCGGTDSCAEHIVRACNISVIISMSASKAIFNVQL